MSSRFVSNLHQRDPRSQLFEGYNPPTTGPSTLRTDGYGGGGYSYGYSGSPGPSEPPRLVPSPGGFRMATPNSKGQYSDATLNELERQNYQEVSGILGKVRILKDLSVAMGVEIRDSSAMTEKMNSSFDSTGLQLKGTMNRMMVMAQRTGVGWKVWIGFLAMVIFLFFWVWV